MKKNIKTLITYFGLVCCLGIASPGNSEASPVLALALDGQAVDFENNFSYNLMSDTSYSLDVFLSLDSADYPTGLYGASFNVNFLNSFSIDGATFDNTVFTDAASNVSVANQVVTFGLLVDYNDNSGPTGIFKLGSIGFNPLSGEGVFQITSSRLSSSDYDFSDFAGNGFTDDVTFLGGTVTVSAPAVPIPGAVWLLGSGLAGMVCYAQEEKIDY
jgi:hypothetical protein